MSLAQPSLDQFVVMDGISWENLHVHLFDPATGRYLLATASAVLPGIDLSAVARCARIEESSEAILEFRKSLG